MRQKANPTMPFDMRPKCPFLHCFAGVGLAGQGRCYLFGMWWHPACPCFEDEVETLESYRRARDG